MFAHCSFLDYEIPVAGASDYVPGPFEPLMAIQSMVTRKDYRGRVWGERQKVTVDEALASAHCTEHASPLRSRSKELSLPASWPTSWCWPMIRTKSNPTASRISPCCGRWSAVELCTTRCEFWSGNRCIRATSGWTRIFSVSAQCSQIHASFCLKISGESASEAG